MIFCRWGSEPSRNYAMFLFEVFSAVKSCEVLWSFVPVRSTCVYFISVESDCKKCPAGFYCESGTSNPIPCPPGTYNGDPGKGDLKGCAPCRAGMACTKDGLTYPDKPCDTGHFCPLGTVNPKDHPCPAGTYTDHHNITAQVECTECPAGQSCKKGTGGIDTPPQACGPGKCLEVCSYAANILQLVFVLSIQFHSTLKEYSMSCFRTLKSLRSDSPREICPNFCQLPYMNRTGVVESCPIMMIVSLFTSTMEICKIYPYLP